MDWVSSSDGHLGLYGDIDIALDTFPYNGTTTTCEALWMGVPVVTLAGDRHAARVGASLLQQVGATEWIAANESDYVEIACDLAGDEVGLAEGRRHIRDRLCASALMDEVGFAREMEQAIYSMIDRRRAKDL